MDERKESIAAVPEGEFSGLVLDPEKCRQLSLVEKRELVHEVARWPADAPKILSSFTRRELLEIICAELGKERKYTGLTKCRMIDNLLRIVNVGTPKRQNTNEGIVTSPLKSQPAPKRLKKSDGLNQLLANSNSLGRMNTNEEQKFLLCENLVCRATLCPEDGFCKRCSCCICHRYDDNKDPSLWLTCNSDPPYVGNSCGMSCHLKCALKHQQAGIMKNGCFKKLDGRFSCVACGKVNDLMSTWRKQLLVAKEARRVDVLCLRISLSHKILDGAEVFKDLHKHVDTAMKKLKKELGPLDRVCARMDRGIVNRLSCGAEVQKLCDIALESSSSFFSNLSSYSIDHGKSLTCNIHFEESYSNSVTIVLEYEHHLFEDFLGCRLWHKESSSKSYPEKPTSIVLRPEKKYKIYNLKPSTEYTCRVSLFSHTKTFGTWEAKWLTSSLSKPLSGSDQNGNCEMGLNVATNHNHLLTNPAQIIDKVATVHINGKLRLLDDITSFNYGEPRHPPVGVVPSFMSPVSVPSTPSKVDGKVINYLGVGPPPVTKNKKSDGSEFEYCVRVVKSLECQGHLSMDFRVKFLTWYSLKATKQERRVVSAFVDAMVDDPPSLAGQLIDTFADEICGDKPSSHSSRICTKLWH